MYEVFIGFAALIPDNSSAGEESYLMVKHIELVEMPLFFVVKFNLNLKKNYLLSLKLKFFC
jgi:hypothetical protein